MSRDPSSSGRCLRHALIALLCLSGGPVAGQSGWAVDLELVLAIDCSYSVDTGEFELQKRGLAEAFRTGEVIAAIRTGPHQSIAVTVVEWSKPGAQEVVVPWTVVQDEASGAALAARIESAPRLTQEGATSISSMIEFAIASFAVNRFECVRKVIDISSDGRNNTGRRVDLVRMLAVAQGVTVNGLVILNEVGTLDFYFEQHVIAGPDAFVIRADDYESYALAILRKLIREIGAQPIS